MTGKYDILNFPDLFQRVVITVEMGCGIVVGFTGPGIAFWRTGEKHGNGQKKRIYEKILQE